MSDPLDIALWPAGTAQKLDVYLQAAFKTRFAGYLLQRGGDLVGVALVVVLPGASRPEEALGAAFLHQGDDLLSRISSSVFQRGRDGDWEGYLCADLTALEIKLLAVLPMTREIQLCAPLLPHRPVPRRTGHAQRSEPAASEILINVETVLAVIDHGCPFAHAAIRDAHGRRSRIVAIWDQDPVPDFPVATGTTPRGTSYGRQVDSAAIDRFLQESAGPDGRPDEDRCYRIAQYGAVEHRVTHGCATLGLLASKRISPSLLYSESLVPSAADAEIDDAAANAPVLFVQLPRSVPLAPSRGAVDRYVLDGLSYLVNGAGGKTKRMSVVVPYGTDMGPHDGSSLFELAVDAWVAHAAERGLDLQVVFASGNAFDDDRAAVLFPEQAALPASDVELDWWIPTDNETLAFQEIWLAARSGDLMLDITPPGREAAQLVNLDSSAEGCHVWPSAGDPQLVVTIRKVQAQRQIMLQVAPTVRGAGHPSVASSGRWRLTFRAKNGIRPGPAHAYAAWGGRNFGFQRRSMATRFFVRSDQAEAGWVKLIGSGTALGSGCGALTWMVGGYERWMRHARAVYSGAGRPRGGPRAQPDKGPTDGVALTEEAPSLRGLLCIGTRSGMVSRVAGTSVAAPQAARELAERGALDGAYPDWIHDPAPPAPASAEPTREEFGEQRLWYPYLQPSAPIAAPAATNETAGPSSGPGVPLALRRSRRSPDP